MAPGCGSPASAQEAVAPAQGLRGGWCDPDYLFEAFQISQWAFSRSKSSDGFAPPKSREPRSSVNRFGHWPRHAHLRTGATPSRAITTFALCFAFADLSQIVFGRLFGVLALRTSITVQGRADQTGISLDCLNACHIFLQVVKFFTNIHPKNNDPHAIY